jgi:hypothetical protein
MFHTTTLVLCKTGVGVSESSRVAARSQLSPFSKSKAETQGQLSRRRGISNTPRSSSPDLRDSQNFTITSVELDESS